MKLRNIAMLLVAAVTFSSAVDANSQSLSRLISGAKKAIQAVKLSDAEIQNYVHEYITGLDAKSTVCDANSPYTLRLNKLTTGLTDIEGVPLNFKVYVTNDVNAFACADGSVRVYSGLMDLMTDDEVLGVIGHEIGHVAHKDTKEAFKNALYTSALKDGLAASSNKVATLTDSQIGAIGEKLLNAKYSRKQEQNADDYGYEFLKAHGKNPWAMAMAFEKLQKLEGTSSSASSYVKNLFSDHPEIAARIKRVSERATEDGYSRPSPTVKAKSSASTKKSVAKKSTKKKATKKSKKR